MTIGAVVISDFDELLALHRTIMEAKFHEHLEQIEIAGSPLVASVANRVLDAIIESEHQTHGPERSRVWEEWRQVSPAKRQWRIALSRVDPSGLWPSWSWDEKKHFAELLLSPLSATEELLDRFIREADARGSS